MTVPLASRVAACRALGDRLESFDDEELADLVVGTRLASGWGATHQIALDGTRVVAKRVPVTDVERADLESTRNPYRLDERGLLPIGRELLALLTSHADAIRYMHSFAAAARRGWSASVTFDDPHLERLLRGSGYLAG